MSLCTSFVLIGNYGIFVNVGHRGGIASAFAWSPLAYDTLIFTLTIYKTIGPNRKDLAPASKIAGVMLKDGTMYYRYVVNIRRND